MGDKTETDRRIAQTAARKQRQVTRAQLLALGMHRDSISYWAKHGRLYRTFPGVYSLGCPPITPHERAMAAVLACGEGAVLSHGSALALWGIWKRWDLPFDVTTKLDRRPKGIRVHRNRLHGREVTRHCGIPTTTLARALMETAPKMPTKSLNRAINTGRQNGHLSLDAPVEVARRNPRHPGRGKLAYCIGIAPERPTRSQFEADFPAFCRRHGLPEPEIDATVCGYEVDAYFPEQKVIVELDGWEST